MHRVNIVYATRGGDRFDWRHYLNKHLPIACGISSRHAPIIKCDVDRPIELGPEPGSINNGSRGNAPLEIKHDKNAHHIIAICAVYFPDLATQNKFRDFFASGHQDSLEIIADEPNYTTIQPTFNAGQCERISNSDAKQSFRVRFLLPRQPKSINTHALRTAVQNLVVQFENLGIEHSFVEIDECQHDVPQDSTSAYNAIASIAVDDINTLRRIAQHMSADNSGLLALQEQFGVRPVVIFSEVVDFDLVLCKPYLVSNPENPQ